MLAVWCRWFDSALKSPYLEDMAPLVNDMVHGDFALEPGLEKSWNQGVFSHVVLTLPDACAGDDLVLHSPLAGLDVSSSHDESGTVSLWMVASAGSAPGSFFEEALANVECRTSQNESGTVERTVFVEGVDASGAVLNFSLAVPVVPDFTDQLMGLEPQAEIFFADDGQWDEQEEQDQLFIAEPVDRAAFVAEHSGPSSMLGIYRLADANTPIEPEIVMPHGNDPNTLISAVELFGVSKGVHFFLVPDNSIELDLSQSLHFVRNAALGCWELSVGEYNESVYIPVKFEHTYLHGQPLSATFEPGAADVALSEGIGDASVQEEAGSHTQNFFAEDISVPLLSSEPHAESGELFISAFLMEEGQETLNVSDYLEAKRHLTLDEGLHIENVRFNDADAVTQLLIADQSGEHELVLNLMGVSRGAVAEFEASAQPDADMDALVRYLVGVGITGE